MVVERIPDPENPGIFLVYVGEQPLGKALVAALSASMDALRRGQPFPGVEMDAAPQAESAANLRAIAAELAEAGLDASSSPFVQFLIPIAEALEHLASEIRATRDWEAQGFAAAIARTQAATDQLVAVVGAFHAAAKAAFPESFED